MYNPYHFVPVGARDEAQRKNDLSRKLLTDPEAGSTTHERYVKGTHTGRLICKLTTKTPLVVGAEQTKRRGQIGEVKPYLVQAAGDKEKRPAVPGSSLRGLISSLAEAASNSALRVLSGGSYSYRKPFKPMYTLSAIGIITRGGDGRLKLKPVALPTLERGRDGSYVVPPRFKRIFPKPAFKVYMGDEVSIRRDEGLRTSPNENAIHERKTAEVRYNAKGNLDSHPSLHCKPNKKRHDPKFFVVAQDADDRAPKRKGLLRILGCWGERTKHIPEGKKHELWLPLPGPDVRPVDIDPQAIQRFHDLADERTEASLKAEDPVMPFHPLDTARNEDQEVFGQKFRLKPGDLVYFDVNEEGTLVTEIALSAIWRGQVNDSEGKAAGAMEFFQAVDPELVPFGPDREQITIAERMFGFVEEKDPDDKTSKDQGLGLAGRIRVSDALLAQGVSREKALEEESVDLRILSSPKPPSPALYFKPATGPGRWIGKFDLKPGQHHPQGRKMYLHHTVKRGAQPWKTTHPGENADQKNRVRPVRAGQEFSFHIDFENLTEVEMGLLLYALAPDNGFHHKLGMGKPLGLGSVKIEVQEWQVLDRQARYSVAGLRAVRYAESRHPLDAGFWRLRDAAITSGLVSREIHNAICLLGNYAAAPAAEQVHTPTLADQSDPESKTFKWFVENDKVQQKSLQPLNEAKGVLPQLVRP